MHIVHISSELAPIAKVGGLADVLLGLSREQTFQGHDVDIFLPKYDCLDASRIRDLKLEGGEFKSFFDGDWYRCLVFRGFVENLRVYFVDPHHKDLPFSRGCFYGCEDDPKRFLIFTRAVLDFLKNHRIYPDVLHLHDWPTAVAPILLKDLFGQEFKKTKTVLTIHNLSYQGVTEPGNLDKVGLDSKKYLKWNELEDPKLTDKINLLKGGITYSDAINTVSPTYAKEILTPEFGCHLEPLLQYHKKKLSGILNGIDHTAWNPETDPFLSAHFTSRDFPKDQKDFHTIDRKGFLKKTLRKSLNLDEGHKPIICCISRLVPQKGLKLIERAIYRTVEKGGQFVLLGSSGIPEVEATFEDLQKEFQSSHQVHLQLTQDEALAHLIYAGSDMIIVPSLFEPCGLTQLIALRYGTIPIVRATGGLADTVEDIELSKKPEDLRNGFVFDKPDMESLDEVLDRAMNYWFKEKENWRLLEKRAMQLDTSWKGPTRKYLSLYESLGSLGIR